ncbi:hypothetical protein [uncultured Ruegeria sp.]|uniref:hypothetical protein n=1 Tax=uncultured Ruegeria sp. TaxID=259304 RepID=UPI00261A0B33|nr:hypothetical protein [uncultured Ruegeria sp.]
MTQISENLRAEIARVRTREEKRLIRVAKASGYFGQKITSQQLTALLKALVKQSKRESQLKRLEDRMKVQNKKQSEQERREDTRRKILLGAFLIAQIEHRPEDFGWVSGELRKFLDQHKDASVAARNRKLMSEFLR